MNAKGNKASAKAAARKPRLGPPVVAILMETSRSFGRGVIRGISNYARAHTTWNFYIQPGDFEQRLPPSDIWTIDAAIGRVANAALASELQSRNIPVVCLEPGPYPGPRWVNNNTREVCRLAFEHLRQRGFKRFAFYGTGTYWGNARGQYFGQLVQQAGMSCEVFAPANQAQHDAQLQLAAWLEKLTKPVGLFAQDDLSGREAIDACRYAGVAVPQDVAVLGVDNDELVCDISLPSLSSVELNCQRIGYEAARVLDGLMHNQQPETPVEVAPVGVVARHSTDIVGVDDAVVADAIRFIRERVSKPISVEDILDHVCVSRRTLEMRFEKAIGRPPHEELQRIRLQRAREMLINTDLKLTSIVRQVGFSSIQYMHRIFKRELGLTPIEFRRKNRAYGA